MTSTRQAISIITKSAKSTAATTLVSLYCHVRPGASKVREGIVAITDEAVELCVSAPAQDGKANKAVLQILAQALLISKSDLQIVQGAKGRDKTISFPRHSLGWHAGEDVTKLVDLVRERLQPH